MTDRKAMLELAETRLRIRCAGCGRFIGYDEMDPRSLGTARHHFEPASHFGPEVNEWLCGACQ